jgi:hypothetical protein
MGVIFGAIAFVVLFAAWVVVPSIIRKHHEVKSAEDGEE